MKPSAGTAGLVVGLVLSVFASPALAHAAYESSDPANGTTVSSPPSRVTAEFTEPLVDGSRLEVYDPCGSRVDNGDSLVAADRLTVSMSADKQGTYRVHFEVVSSVDGHPTSGDFGFTSSGGSPCPGEEPVEEDPGASGGNGGDASSSNDGSGGGGSETSDMGDSGTVSGGGNGTQSNERAASTGDRSPRNNTADRVRGERGRTKVAGTRLEREAGDIAPTAISASDIENIWEGIPVGGFVIAMLVAASIGGAGGLVYAGIMGPKR